MKVYCSYHYFNHTHFFLENLVLQSFTTENRLFSSYINNLYLYSGWISALFRCAAQRCPLVGHRLCPQTEVMFLASAAAICPCVKVSRSAAQLTEWCLATSGHTRHECYHPSRTVGRDADSVASSHSTPIRVQYCLYSESGLFWAI